MSDNSGGAANTDDATTGDADVIVPWSVVWVTLIISFAVGFVFYVFFAMTRSKHSKSNHLTLYEKRLLTRSSTSPPAFTGSAWFGWAVEAFRISDDEALKFMGLDCFMFTRLLRLGFRMSTFGSILGVLLMIVYGTGKATGAATEQFNVITIASVEQQSARLWATALAFLLFMAFTMRSLYLEWRDVYAPLRSQFLATGDVNTPKDYRYSVMLESVPVALRSNAKLHSYLDQLFPKQVKSVYVVQNTTELDKLIEERQTKIEALEKAIAFTKAKPTKPAPQMKENAKLFGLLGGPKVDAIHYLNSEIDRLNKEIDAKRAMIHEQADRDAATAANEKVALGDSIKQQQPDTKYHSMSDPDMTKSDPDISTDQSKQDRQAATAFVTFTSLRAKQTAVQCELSGKVDNMDCENAPIPNGILWRNVPVSVTRQRYAAMLAAAFWITGAVFWALPVLFVTGLANLNSLLTTFKLPTLNANTFYYGIISGILPVVFLQILMMVLYMSIEGCAKRLVRVKSMGKVDSYTFFWHQIYQFANLWLILIGGSAFNQLHAILEDPSSIATILAKSLPGASTFFVNLIIMGSFLAFGLELSQFVPYIVNKIIGMITSEPAQTQRMLDAKLQPPSIAWGKTLPPVVFIVMVTLIYMPIVPLMEIFAMVYFGGWYLVWKHQCLHVYAQEFEGGGLIWETLSSFFMACVYMAEFILCAYLGLKEAPGPAIFTLVVTVIGTLLTHYQLRRNIAGPLKNLSLVIAAKIDTEEGELALSEADAASSAQAVESLLYAQPSLKASEDERGPMPYRRKGDGTDEEAPAFTDSPHDDVSEGEKASTEVVFEEDASKTPTSHFM
ncbi:hypothetical protein MPSEU_001080200 [Mayamaea pseudoterrestris]|nr:hypothetical protein MPSEU_001080200 [Mayamaea pseudoterrestris]